MKAKEKVGIAVEPFWDESNMEALESWIYLQYMDEEPDGSPQVIAAGGQAAVFLLANRPPQRLQIRASAESTRTIDLMLALAQPMGVQLEDLDRQAISRSNTAEPSWKTGRCGWAEDPLLAAYHDVEWGRLPVTDARWFEFLTLETFQAGLSWRTILQKRLAFRAGFSGFNPASVAQYGEVDIDRLLQDAGIVRNRKKIEAAVANAQIALALIQRYGSLNAYFRSLIGGDEAAVLTVLQKTFRFVGRTTAESIAFATGIVPAPHDAGCFREQVNPAG